MKIFFFKVKFLAMVFFRDILFRKRFCVRVISFRIILLLLYGFGKDLEMVFRYNFFFFKEA